MPTVTAHGHRFELAPADQQLRTLPRSLRDLRYEPRDVDRVLTERGLGDARALLGSAARFDDGDRIIDIDELRAGAAYLESPAARQLDDSVGRRHRWRNTDVDAVMARYGIGDAEALIRAAIAIDDGDRYLDNAELEGAASKLGAKAAGGMRFTPSVLADVMQRSGVASATAILNEARRQDDGDRVLQKSELEAAARVVGGIVAAHDVSGINKRIDALGRRAEITVRTLGNVGAHPVKAMHFASTGNGEKTKVLITAGVHGNEPCGPGAALLLAEQLLAHPELRDGFDITIVPLVNPQGMLNATRRNQDGLDLNRNFDGLSGGPAEAQIIEGLFASQDFELVLDLHSGGSNRNGFWALHVGSDELLSPAFGRFGKRWPLLHGDTRPYDLSQPGVGESSNGATLKGLGAASGARWAATLEAPGSVSYLDQVLGQNDMVNEILSQARQLQRQADGVA